MVRRTRGRFIRPAARTKQWIGAGIGGETLAASSQTLSAVLSAGALLLRPFTVLRTHMLLTVRSDQQAAIENIIASFGMIVVTSQAAGIGVTAIPSPSSISGDPDADWFVWQALQNEFFIDINGTDGIGVDGSNGVQYTIDSKAMRKVGPDDQLVNVFTVDTATGANVSTQGRMLIQLH